jgi:hypothetical protein
MRCDGPAPAYAVIHTSHHIPQNTPLHPEIPTPRGYIYFSEGSCERSFLRLNSQSFQTFRNSHESFCNVGYLGYLGYQAFKHMQEKHKLVLDFIKAYIKLHGVAPSYTVIAKGLGMKSKSNIHRIIHKLKDEGLVAVKPYQFNSIRVIDKSVREVASL